MNFIAATTHHAIEPLAVLKTISYNSLSNRTPTAVADLLTAAVTDGFCYLDLTGNEEGRNIWRGSGRMRHIMEHLFNLPLEEKMEYDTDKLGNLRNYGYKPVGRNTGVEKGKEDGHELFLLPTDVLLSGDPEAIKAPNILKNKHDLLKVFTENCNLACIVILLALSEALNLTENRSLHSCHRFGAPCTSALAVFKYHQSPADPANMADFNPGGHIAHTDVGSLTMLFSNTPGLQLLQPATETWAFVAPKQGHAIINIGDSLRFLTGCRLKSCLHRVVPTPEIAKTGGVRYSMAYFMRPEYTAKFTDDSGKQWTSLAWHTRKFDVFRGVKEGSEEEEGVLLGKLAA